MDAELIIHSGLEAICPASLTSTFPSACPLPALSCTHTAGSVAAWACGLAHRSAKCQTTPDVRSVPTPAYFQVGPLAGSLRHSLVAIVLWK